MRTQNTRHGASGDQFGVRRSDLRKLAKKIKTNHELAKGETENIDARFLATLLMKPQDLSTVEMDLMVRSVKFLKVADWLNSYVV